MHRQVKRIAQKLDTNGDVVAKEDFNKPLAELTLKEASACIDNLKKALESLPGSTGGQR